MLTGAVGVQPGIGDGAGAAVECVFSGLCDRNYDVAATVCHGRRDKAGYVGVSDALNMCGAVFGNYKVFRRHMVGVVPCIGLTVDGVCIDESGVAAAVDDVAEVVAGL